MTRSAPFASLDDGRPFEIVVGRVKAAAPNRDAVRPAYLIAVDLGSRGVQKTEAALSRAYTPEELIGRQLLCAVEVPPRKRKRLQVSVMAALCSDRGAVVLGPGAGCDEGTEVS